MVPRRPRRPFSAHPAESSPQRVRFAQRVLSGVLDTLDMSRAQFAAACDIGAKTVERWCGADERRCSAPLHALLALPEKGLVEVAEVLLESTDHAVVELPKSAGAGPDIAAAARMMAEASDVLRVHANAIADGRICAAEGREIETECRQLIAATLSVMERAQQAQREGVVGLRRIEGKSA